MDQCRQPVVLFPSDIESGQIMGCLYGYRHDETRTFHVVSCSNSTAPTGLALLGEILPGSVPTGWPSDKITGHYHGGKLRFTYQGSPCDLRRYSLVQDLFSRNTGILETASLLALRVIIVGCGSVGSFVALELARSGVGHFLLIDNDILMHHNVCRHQCGLGDVGRWKVNAVRDRILNINPGAEVDALASTIETLDKDVFDRSCTPETVVVGCADNRESDLYANKICCLYGIPFVSIGLWRRAFAGEIFWAIPGETPCYYCGFGGSSRIELSQRTSAAHRFYTSEEDLRETTFEPGISVDISFVTTIGIKLTLDLLNRRNSQFRPKLIGHLTQFTLICNTNHAGIGGEMSELFDHALQITHSIEMTQLANCPHCQLWSGKRDAPSEGVPA